MATLTTDDLGGITRVTWETLATGGTIPKYEPVLTRAIAGSIQFVGTFGGATVTLTGSNDGTNYVTLDDMSGTAISFTAAGAAEFTTTMRYLKPGISGGSSDDVDAFMVLRG